MSKAWVACWLGPRPRVWWPARDGDDFEGRHYNYEDESQEAPSVRGFQSGSSHSSASELVCLPAGRRRLAAWAAWAIIEPFFSDMLYLQGQVRSVSSREAGDTHVVVGNQCVALHVPLMGSVDLDGRKSTCRRDQDLGPGKTKALEGMESLRVGQTIGVYVEHHALSAGEDVALGAFVVPDPPPARRPTLSLSQQEPEEFALLIKAAESGPTIETIPGLDRAMMYILAAWTGFRKGEIGSLTFNSFRLDDEPPTCTVVALYSKHKRQDSQVLHPEVMRLLKRWMAEKGELGPEVLLFPVSGRVPNGKERKTHKMMQLDLKAARKEWLEEAKTSEEKASREKSDFLKYQDRNGLFADFHSNRHLFITSLERAGMSPKMAQILARHSDIHLTLGAYTHLGIHDQTLAIATLQAPPVSGNGTTTEKSQGSLDEAGEGLAEEKSVPRVVPRMVPNTSHLSGYWLYQSAPRPRGIPRRRAKRRPS